MIITDKPSENPRTDSLNLSFSSSSVSEELDELILDDVVSSILTKIQKIYNNINLVLQLKGTHKKLFLG